MKVKELVEELQQYDEDFEVVMMGNNSYYQWKVQEVLSGSLRTTEDECVVIREGEQL